ncbi:hypothetical protein [Arthrobacter sp. H35-D1]|uniref:hypothetical protein n=1 Tax=Arthrobacter sp. H35-D1 TaxID=3046202 RepID=UPI0024B8C8CE|nr:hypothetical protein [Arthrobacter sp. H35-D1]MDJ0313285.1 hypothetical protein [Arthrobacter sp. H35-D1]
MRTAPTPTPLNMALESSHAQWWEVLAALGPLAILIGAIAAAAIGAFTLRQRTESDALALTQRREADDRSEWWKRAQWALDRALDDSATNKALGLVTLEVLARSKLAHAEELELFDIAWEAVSDPKNGAADNDSTTGTSSGTEEIMSEQPTISGGE